jgi:hypothetical protein
MIISHLAPAVRTASRFVWSVARNELGMSVSTYAEMSTGQKKRRRPTLAYSDVNDARSKSVTMSLPAQSAAPRSGLGRIASLTLRGEKVVLVGVPLD